MTSPARDEGRSAAARQNPTDRHQLQQIVAGLTEGVILVDAGQDIVWANPAALSMHGVGTLPELGTTVDRYSDRFRLQYRNNHKLSKGDYPIERIIAGEAFRDVVVEVTPPHADRPRWVHRVRSLVLTHATGEPDCLVLILTDVTEQFEAEERFESSFNVNPAPAVICRLADMTYVKVNRGFLQLAELSRDEVIGRPFSEIDLFAQADGREDALALVAQGRAVAQREARLAGPHGSRAVIVAGQPIEIDDGPCMMFTFMDIEPRRAAERELRETHEQARADFEALYTETPVALHALDAEGRIVTVSNRWLELLQFERGEVVGRPITDFLTPAARTAYRDSREAPSPDGIPRDAEYQFVKRSGAIVDVLVSSRTGPDRRETPVRSTAVLTDVTDRKHSEERFAKAFVLAPVPMMLSNLDQSRVMDANQAFLTMIRRPAADVIGRCLGQLGLWADDAEAGRFDAALRGQGSVRNMDLAIRAGDDTTADCLLSAELVNLQGQRCALVVLQDVTDQRRSETELFEALETVMRDTSWFSRSVIEKLAYLRQPGRAPPQGAGRAARTTRAPESLAPLSHGPRGLAISSVLGLSRSTVRNHVASIYAKIGVHSRSGAIVWARERGLIGPVEPRHRR